jgi:hypothetical protein
LPSGQRPEVDLGVLHRLDGHDVEGQLVVLEVAAQRGRDRDRDVGGDLLFFLRHALSCFPFSR